MLPALYMLTFLTSLVTGTAFLLATDLQRARRYWPAVRALRLPALASTVVSGGAALLLWLNKTDPSLPAVRNALGHAAVGLLVPLTLCLIIAALPEPTAGRQAQALGQWQAARFLRWPLLAGAALSGLAYLVLWPFA